MADGDVGRLALRNHCENIEWLFCFRGWRRSNSEICQNGHESFRIKRLAYDLQERILRKSPADIFVSITSG